MIPQTFEAAFERVSALATNFRANEPQYLSPTYSEAQARLDFIDKFWIALGWDVNHETQTNPYEQEVKVERGVTVSASRKRADYAFLAPNFRDVLFYVEAKKPKTDIDNNMDYFQTIRYGWNSRTPLAVLTDFEHFRILDCRYKPELDSALYQAVDRYHYTDYFDPQKFRSIYHLFSREDARKGAIERFAEALPKPSRRAHQRTLFFGGFKNIDESFLEDLDANRGELAQAFARENPELDSYELTEVTQRTLDRLVFMRFLEDKMIEPEPIVENLGSGGPAWQKFVATSRRLDRVYNGIIFKKHALLDSPTFKVDETAFDNVHLNLGHTISPYDFNAIPIHILGSIYERFLGKIITITDKGALIEEKPEVRKAGGVFYTPEYIVRYVVEHTVGKLIRGKSPEQVNKMRFADISCGSGSFLLGIYDLLLRHHTAYYNANKKNRKKGLNAGCLENEDGSLHLSLLQKREILLNNIYGVDVDPQAVEVAQLSLYLKLLEEENVATSRRNQMDLREALLPTLSGNIASGNSLIGWDILDGQLFDLDEERKINPMGFERTFADVMRDGGFDAIVGNPPYVRIQGFPRKQIDYLTRHYQSTTGNFDLYTVFVERAYGLLRECGLFGQILPNKFFKTDYGVGLRKFLSQQKAVSEIVDFGADQVFDASTYSCLLFLSKGENPSFQYAETKADPDALEFAPFVTMKAERLGEVPWSFADEQTASLLDKLTLNSTRLLDLPAELSRGVSTGDDDVFLVQADGCDLEEGILRVPVFSTDFNRYSFEPTRKWKVIFPYTLIEGSYYSYTERELEENFPKAYEYLQRHRARLERRKQFKEWYGYSAPRGLKQHDRAQILVPVLANGGIFALAPEHLKGRLCMMASGGFSLAMSESSKLSPKYVLALLNSRLLFWKLKHLSNVFRGGWITCTKQYFGELPIRTIDFATRSERSAHDKIVSLVDQTSQAKERLASSHSDRDKNLYSRKCADLDEQIDAIVFELYGLDEDEIRLVESSE
jgi:type I restriction-modification system DNA methylase subunit